MDEALNDPRFAHISWDPKFTRVPRRQRKVKIDDRFKSMFTDAKFKARYLVDKRGKVLNTDSTDNLRKYYDLTTSESDDDEEQAKNLASRVKTQREEKANGKNNVERISVGSEKESDIESESEASKAENDSDSAPDEPKICLDLARGEGNIDSSSDDEDDEWKLDDDDAVPEHKWGELDADAPRTEKISSRLAVCNMDWDRVKAKDLLVLFNSFKPPLGYIKSVKIYQSKFGKERMAQEQVEGPKELLELKQRLKSQNLVNDSESSDLEDDRESDDDQNDKIDRIKAVERETIRQYQLNRLKYFYAVLECDCPETANAIYESCDGTEYESSAAKLDLRFIPDDTNFDDETPTDEVNELGDLNSYEPVYFRNAALQQSRVELTWDQTSQARKTLLKEAFDKEKLDQVDLKEILASASSSASSDDEECEKNRSTNQRDALKSLVENLLQKKEEKRPKDAFFIDENDGDSTDSPDGLRSDRKNYGLRRDLKTVDEEKNGLQCDFKSANGKSGLQRDSESNDNHNSLQCEFKPGDDNGLQRDFKPSDKNSSLQRDFNSCDNDGLHRSLKSNDKTNGLQRHFETNGLQSGSDDDEGELRRAGLNNDSAKIKKSGKSTEKEGGTPWQKYLEKRREKRIQKRNEAKKRLVESKKINTSRRFDDDYIPEGIDLNDPYFKEELDQISTAEPDDPDQIDDVIDEEETERQKRQLELLLADSNETTTRNYNLNKLLTENERSKVKAKKKRKRESNGADKKPSTRNVDGSKPESDFKLNVADRRFSALYDSALFNIDPTEPAFKKTKNMQILVEEKLKRIKDRPVTAGDNDIVKELKPAVEKSTNCEEFSQKSNSAAEISLLVKSLKSKTSCIQANKKSRPEKSGIKKLS